MGKEPKRVPLTIKAWPQLIAEAEQHVGWLGCDVEEVARFLLVRALDDRRRERAAERVAQQLAGMRS